MIVMTIENMFLMFLLLFVIFKLNLDNYRNFYLFWNNFFSNIIFILALVTSNPGLLLGKSGYLYLIYFCC